jgi:hypothetical protein
MKAKVSLSVVALALVLALGFAACSRARDDAQIAGEVQQKIFSDPAIQSRQITVQSANGIVTLTGNVANESERAATASQAAQVAGVKTVVNNLEVAAPAVAAAPPAAEPAAAEPAPEPAPAPRRVARAKPSPARRASAVEPEEEAAPVAQASTPKTPTELMPPANTETAPPPAPKKVTLPAGTVLSVRLTDGIDSERNKVGDIFHATLDTPITVDGEVVVPANADIQGRVANVTSAGHYTGKSSVALELTSLKVNDRTYNLQTDQYSREGSSRGSQTAKRVGTGAAIGAIIGAIAGGGKGAAIGGAVGAGAGGGVQTATKGQQVKLDPEALLSFRLQNPLTVYAAAQVNSGRTKLPN